MYFQKFIKGINGIKKFQAEHMLENGIPCNWWRNQNRISPIEVKSKLIEPNVELHLNKYDKQLPSSHPEFAPNRTYGDISPFISTTAGAYQRAYNDQYDFGFNKLFSPLVTALGFATKTFTSDGVLFYGYLITLGKKAVEMQQFAEEVREMHIYTNYLPHHHEGEIMAKIIIPSVQIEKVEFYDSDGLLEKIERKEKIKPTFSIKNLYYKDPNKFSNIREIL
ncbi:hypothetical protein [Pedobacter hiemivivus]|uniref:Uncharacterized protein n=1 Tax=Pedobacter hiemivivus TaxID=2530454 RepID=A0A4R0N528_9SPHI|nr:hypothetical protein [Pedobacter hiemivivus]TCC95038.1 hypothetical protein EZ444_16155 [Pedobacter hiemivivus]